MPRSPGATLADLMVSHARRCRRLLDRESAQEIADSVLRCQDGSGGFRGRGGEADLYYTLFAVDCLLALGRPLPTEGLSAYLASFADGDGLDFVHLCCLVRCRARVPGMPSPAAAARRLADRVETFRTADGGFSATPEDGRTSLYGIFLATLALEELGRMPRRRLRLVRAARSLRAGDGGVANSPEMPVGTTTATAAAVAVQCHFGLPLDEQLIDWLRQRRDSRGGYAASPGTPVPELRPLFPAGSLGKRKGPFWLKPLRVSSRSKHCRCRERRDWLLMNS